MDNRIDDHIVQDRWLDSGILHRKGFDVNMYLFRTSGGYKSLILSIIEHMHDLTMEDFSNYGAVKGISGANIGIPLNIVGIRITKEAEKVCDGEEDTIFFMINPRIVSKSEETGVVKSNCGSIRLQEKIEVERYEWIKVEYYDTNGERKEDKFDGAFGSTLQHEIDHNLGILITDRTKE